MSQKAFIRVKRSELETEQFQEKINQLNKIGTFFFLNNINKHFQYWVFECEKIDKNILFELRLNDYFIQ